MAWPVFRSVLREITGEFTEKSWAFLISAFAIPQRFRFGSKRPDVSNQSAPSCQADPPNRSRASWVCVRSAPITVVENRLAWSLINRLVHAGRSPRSCPRGIGEVWPTRATLPRSITPQPGSLREFQSVVVACSRSLMGSVVLLSCLSVTQSPSSRHPFIDACTASLRCTSYSGVGRRTEVGSFGRRLIAG